MLFENQKYFKDYIYNELGIVENYPYSQSDPRFFIQTSLYLYFRKYEHNENFDKNVNQNILNFLTKTLPFFAETLSLQHNFYQFASTPAALIYYTENSKKINIQSLYSIPVAAVSLMIPSEKKFIKNLNLKGKRLLLESVSKSTINLPFNEGMPCNVLYPYCLSLQNVNGNYFIIIRTSRKQVDGNNIRFVTHEEADIMTKDNNDLFIVG